MDDMKLKLCNYEQTDVNQVEYLLAVLKLFSHKIKKKYEVFFSFTLLNTSVTTEATP